MAHDYVHELWRDQSTSIGRRMIATLVGGVLILASVIAGFIFPDASPAESSGMGLHAQMVAYGRNYYADLLGFIGALLLGIPLIWHAVEDLLRGHAHMDELVALGVFAAFVSGDYQTAGAIAFFMILATLIEHRTAEGARASIESLIRISPTRAFKLTNEIEVEIDAKELHPGDRVRVRPGDNIPGDGQVVLGESTVNQANITGESLPVDKKPGDEVFGGTINLTGMLEVIVTKTGADTTLGRVQSLILQAERSRMPISRLIDRYARWYTPTVIMLAGIVLFFTRELDRAVAMLVIACPCAIVLATPTAMVAALSAAARLGILIKNVTDLEIARNLTGIVFDKTGTLTQGRLIVTRLHPAPEVDPAELLGLAACAEQNSRHPAARAVVEMAQKAKLTLQPVEDFEEAAGRGVKASLGGVEIHVGRAHWIQAHGGDLSAFDLQGAGAMSLLFVMHGQQVLGWIGLEDKTRPEAASTLSELNELGIKQLVMITGDREAVARKVAGEIGCTEYSAEVLPGEKLERVEALKSRGHVVAVVGDGVNDAPALAAGNISIAMGAAGSDVAIHSASIALMNDKLNRIPFLIRLSRDTIRVVRQNLIFGIGYIVVLEIFSALGMLSPIAAALCHMAGSILVVFNSARLVRAGEALESAEHPERSMSAPKAEPMASVEPKWMAT